MFIGFKGLSAPLTIKNKRFGCRKT